MTAPDVVDRFRDALVAAGYTYDGVAAALGPEAHAALSRNETVPGLRRTSGGSPLETLTRLFLLQGPVGLDRAEAALPGLVDPLCAEGLLERSVGEVAARLDCRPYSEDDTDLWVVSDLTPGLDGAPNRVGADHVLGISSASTSLARLTIREPVHRALDLGTGCGVQALHLAGHAGAVVATDVNVRALRIADLNARLNGLDNIQVREGSFFEPVRGETFDLIATNPPFVISPATGERLVYRDSGLPGDRVVEDIVRGAPAHLTVGGWCQVLGNWVVGKGRPWDERLAGWVEHCDAWVVQREVVDPATYVEMWLKDAGHHGGPDYLRRYDTWLSWFEDQRIEAVGFGWVNLRRTDAEPVVRLEEWPYDVEQPVAPAIAAWGAAVAHLRDVDDDALAARHLVARADVRQETDGRPGAEDPETIVLRQQRGLRRARKADTVEAALVGACDGDLSVDAILAALAELLGLDPAEVRETRLPVVRELVVEGFLETGQAGA
ncbi:class I SAM-dependent methyltransferase [Nocardioides guangzhouensis]|uniref:Class I SAM-dependent methyltransferase n=1 Tax=Nocardioides guangzhouensis TaxID=2497878 RepID=A0A4Q4ZIA6_9ACTN|nr:class I SAM-dependent methyltransferase [Nocardioides guangzhouensis]RYP87291.1 class I SAM-dependent methyltransferase [Nocardioides guangzhouensis]